MPRNMRALCLAVSIFVILGLAPLMPSAEGQAGLRASKISQSSSFSGDTRADSARIINTATSNAFMASIIRGEDIGWGKDKSDKDKHYDPWPWWRDPWWRTRDGNRWNRGSGRGPDWDSPPIGNPSRDAFESQDSRQDRESQQDYEDEIYQRVLRDDERGDTRAKVRNLPYPRRDGPYNRGSGDRSYGGHGYDDLTLVLMGFLDWYNTFGLPIPGFDYLVTILKPNVYLYSDVPIEVTVTFPLSGLLTVSIPEYGDGWRVTVSGDGTLRDGEGTYGFLFYESESNPYDFQTHSGFRLGTGDRERRFGEILDLYGFNEAEKADFIEYWTSLLDPGVTYAMYPQDTARLSHVMPIELDAEINHAFRLWFGFEATDREPEAPDIEVIARGGLTLVEWGGFIIP